MKVSLEWLREFVDIDLDVDELVDLLTNTGTSVEGVETRGGEARGLLVAQVVDVTPHPDAERLLLCTVEAGGNRWKIVTGAPNVRVGMKAPFAPPGSVLPGGTVVEARRLRGVMSEGMLLSERELGLSDDHQGIMELGADSVPGDDLLRYLGLPDVVLDLEITPNRPDCLSIVGMAREIAAITGSTLRYPSFSLEEVDEPAEEAVRITLADPDLCPRYVARVIDGVVIGPSPWWIRKRLASCGIRPINNVVDITNYVMLEMGQPLHAFDYHLIRDSHIVVRRARPGERMVTLDGVERVLEAEDLLICDPAGPIALAGVMGGENTEVREETHKVLLESAHFEPRNIMRTSRRLGLSTEASYRFERGVDPAGCGIAADRAAWLMAELAGGKVYRGRVDALARPVERRKVILRPDRARSILGTEVKDEEIVSILSSLELGVEEKPEGFVVDVPTFRFDLEREIDLVEEIARVYRYSRIPSTLPLTSHNVGRLTPEQANRRRIRRILSGKGLREAINYSFISPEWRGAMDPEGIYLKGSPMRIKNPISEEFSELRLSLLPGLLSSLRHNLNRDMEDVFLFEMGRVFLPVEGEKQPREEERLALLLRGRWVRKGWKKGEERADFFTLKGLLEALFDEMRVGKLELAERDVPFLRPSASCRVVMDGEEIGVMGSIHPIVARRLELPEDVQLCEIELEPLLKAVPEVVSYRDIPRYPAVLMDLAIIVDEKVKVGSVLEEIRRAGGEELQDVYLFDLYRSEKLGKDKKSLAFSLTFQSKERTLSDQDAVGCRERIVQALRQRFGALLRGEETG